ncbi:zinc finger CCCH domain-containing protein 8 [Dipodomys spectabilis]|uniref:zinc finger CCCH domain-containing protein 8 n=1 Tax=Dipodomys spectabilis TaxID=105255 RepID=UPI001C538C0E|nr:zinc finger CCCH domain-containing protein 8 [Dipodomys spectabilis]XP_042551356.1 zinc finger CCCH domain-containing protein 8 [Dipodomys spectabilis]XP_042551357.1 zinc finger CCCH domain-containing protein 8 [Dipodomys spectabilis]
MDFENLFSTPPNPALGKRTDSEERTSNEKDDTKLKETQGGKVKWKVKLKSEKIPRKLRHFGNSTASPKSLQYIKSRSKDYDTYSDNDICSEEQEDNFAKELQQYIQAKEMANAAQTVPSPEEPMKKEGAKDRQQAAKQKNKNLKAGNKNSKQKKLKRKWPSTGNKGSDALLKNRGPPKEDGEPQEKQQHVRMSQEFINQHTVERQGKQICKYFLERKCIKGDQCKFDHNAEIEKKKEMCKFYVQGYCTRGENCLYLHNEYPCKFYHTGAKCYQGDYCKFSHAPLTAETQELLAKVLDTEKKSNK